MVEPDSEMQRQMRLQAHLKDRPATELVDLLLELAGEMDDLERQQLWAHLTPSEAAGLIYPSPEVFLAELEDFLQQYVSDDEEDEDDEAEDDEDYDEDWEDDEGEYAGYDELDMIPLDLFPEEADFFGEMLDQYWENESPEPEELARLEALKGFIAEAGAYYQAQDYAVAAPAYQKLVEATLLCPSYAYFDVSDPLEFIGQNDKQFVRRYLRALRAALPLEEYFKAGLDLLQRTGHTKSPFIATFMKEVKPDGQDQLRAFLEEYTARLDDEASPVGVLPTGGLPISLHLLLSLLEESGDQDAARQVWVRFSRRFPVLYVPLLADRVQAEDWPAVIEYGSQALQNTVVLIDTQSRDWPLPSEVNVRTQLSQAYAATGDATLAFSVYRPVFDITPHFETYNHLLQLAQAISPEHAQTIQAEVTDRLRQFGGAHRFLLCQLLLGEGRFDEAYQLVKDLHPFDGQDEVKLVAQAYLLAALGPQPVDLSDGLAAFYQTVQDSGEKKFVLLRSLFPRLPEMDPAAAEERSELLLTRLIRAHIDLGSRGYPQAAELCSLMAELAIRRSRLPKFLQLYADLQDRYKRRKSLLSILQSKVDPLITDLDAGGARLPID